jgi:hypothetical protein
LDLKWDDLTLKNEKLMKTIRIKIFKKYENNKMKEKYGGDKSLP